MLYLASNITNGYRLQASTHTACYAVDMSSVKSALKNDHQSLKSKLSVLCVLAARAHSASAIARRDF